MSNEAPTKNSETLLPCPFCGGEAIVKNRSGSDYGVTEYWAECKSCFSCSHVVPDSKYVSGVRGKDNGYYPVDYMELIRSLWNTRAPERGEGQETGIDWGEVWNSRTDLPSFEKANFDDYAKAAEFGAQIALSRQSAVGGDWENQIRGALKSSIDAHGPITPKNYASAAKRINGQIRALSATRTPEGEALRLGRFWIEQFVNYMNLSYAGQFPLNADAIDSFFGHLSTPPSRPTATGGITAEDVENLTRYLPEIANWRGNHHILFSKHINGPYLLRADVLALIERAGEDSFMDRAKALSEAISSLIYHRNNMKPVQTTQARRQIEEIALGRRLTIEECREIGLSAGPQ